MRVVIENTYTCGRQSSVVADVAEPADITEEWRDEVVHPLTGDGHPCGSTEHAMYTAVITDATREEWVGQLFTWEG